jgi:thiazole/oxazole-forming peptide maturase SagC family component
MLRPVRRWRIEFSFWRGKQRYGGYAMSLVLNDAHALQPLVRPRVRKCYHIIPMEGERVQFRSAHRTLVLRSKNAAQLVQLLALLEGQRTLSEIAALLPDQDEVQIAQIVGQLRQAELLEEASEQVAESFEHQRILFSLLGAERSARDMQARLESARVALIGVGAVGAAALVNLAAAGVGHLTLVDAGRVSPSDVGPLFSATDLGDERVFCAARRLEATRKSLKINSIPRPIGAAKDCVDLLGDDVDLLLLCQDDVQPSLNEWINTACLETGVSWLPAWLEGPVGYVGPTIVPHQTACFTCYQIRYQETRERYEEFLAFDSYLRNGRDPGVTYGTTAALAGVVGGLLAWEAMGILTQARRAASYGKLIKVDFWTSETSTHPVWKYPHCPACSRQSRYPTVYPWDGHLAGDAGGEG